MKNAFDLGIFGIENIEKHYFYPPFLAHSREDAAGMIAERLVRDPSFVKEMDGPFVLLDYGEFFEAPKLGTLQPFLLNHDPVEVCRISELQLENLLREVTDDE